MGTLSNDIKALLSLLLGLKDKEKKDLRLANWGMAALTLASTTGILEQGNKHIIGDTMKAVAPTLSVIPGAGPFIAAGVEAAGSLVNAAWGWNEDANAIAGIKALQNQVKGITADTSSTNSLAKLYSSMPTLGTVKTNDIGSDGWWHNHVEKKANSLTQENLIANTIGQSNLNSGVDNYKSKLLMTYLKNLAYGGPIDSAVGYDFMQQSLLNDLLKLNNLVNRITSMPNSFMNELALGGQRNGGYFSNGLTYVGEGGTHELNPHEGVLIGYDELGTPNLVEEGEYIWNDYVFSNRLKVPKEVKNMFGLGGKKSGYTFAEAVDFIQKESEERPNDPISASALEANLAKLMYIQELLRQQLAQKEQLAEQQVNRFDWGGLTKDYNYNLTGLFGEEDNTKYSYNLGWKKAIELLQQNPEYLRKAIEYGRYILESPDYSPAHQFLFFNKMLNDSTLKSYLTKSKGKYMNLTDDAIKKLYLYYSNGNTSFIHDLAGLAAKSFGLVPSNMLIRVMQTKTDKDGKISKEPVMYNKQPLVFRGTVEDIKKQLDTKGDDGLSLREHLLNEGITIPKDLNVSSLDKKVNYYGDELGQWYHTENENYVATKPHRKDAKGTKIFESNIGLPYEEDLLFEGIVDNDLALLDYDAYLLDLANPTEKPKLPKTINLLNGQDFNPELLYTDPRYKGISLLGSITDPETGDVKNYYGIPDKESPSWLAHLRTASLPYNLGYAITDALGVTNPEDYSLAENIENLNLSVPNISAPRTSTRLRFTATNPYADADLLRDNYLSTKSALEQTSPNAPNLGAVLIGLNHQNNIDRGNAYLKAVKANRDLYNQIMLLNANLEHLDNTLAATIAQANQLNAQNNNNRILDLMYKGAALRQASDEARSLAINANLDALFTDLTNIGKEHTQKNWINTNNAFDYGISSLGDISFKDIFSNPEVLKQLVSTNKKNGGYLTIK